MVKSRRDKKGAKQFDELICVELIAPNTLLPCAGEAFWDEPPIQPLAFRIVFPTFQLDTVTNVSTDSSNLFCCYFFSATKSQF